MSNPKDVPCQLSRCKPTDCTARDDRASRLPIQNDGPALQLVEDTVTELCFFIPVCVECDKETQPRRFRARRFRFRRHQLVYRFHGSLPRWLFR